MNPNIERILSRLNGVKQQRPNAWKACCPSHQDDQQSLSITVASDGKILLKCFAGCAAQTIAQDAGFRMSDLFPPQDAPPSKPTPKRITKIYRYTDEAGKLLFEAVRYEPKEFCQRRPDGNGGYLYNLTDVRRVPYRLPELLKAVASGETVYLVEGEKDADRLSQSGLTATTTAGGAKGWRKEYGSFFQNAHLIIIPDNDESGGDYAANAARDISPVAASLRVLELPNLPPKGDVSDWMNAGGTGGELEALAEAAPLSELGAQTIPGSPETPLFDAPPRPLTPQLRAVPKITHDMIPEPLREWIFDIAERGSFPAEYVAAPALVALSAVVGRRVGIRPKRYDDWTVVPNLYGAVVGPPGMQKTPAVSEAMRPLTRLETEAREQYEREEENHRVAQFLAKTKAEVAKGSVKNAVKLGTMTEQELQLLALEATADETIEPPICARYTVNDVTVEKLGELLKENPNGLLMFRDELTGWLRTLDRQGHEADRAFYLEAWNGTGGFTYDRIGRGTTRIDAACISLFGTIQPGPLARYLRGSVAGEDADGLTSRLQILVYPDPPATFVNVDRYAKTDAKNRAYLIFKRLSELPLEDIGATVEGEGIPFLKFDSAAQDFFDAWRTDLENRLRSGRETAIVTTHLSKYRSLLPSLALLFHLIDGKAESAVSLPSVTLAAHWCDFLEAHTRRVYQSAMDGDTETAQMLADRIAQSLPNPFRPRDVQRKGWAGLKTPDEVETAIGILEDRGWLRTVEKPSGEKGGRPSVEVYINPAVLDGSVSFVSTSEYESAVISEHAKEGSVSSVSTQTHTNGDFSAGGKKSDGGGYDNTYMSTTINNSIEQDTKNSEYMASPTDRTVLAPENTEKSMGVGTDRTDKTPDVYSDYPDPSDLDPFDEDDDMEEGIEDL